MQVLLVWQLKNKYTKKAPEDSGASIYLSVLKKDSGNHAKGCNQPNAT